MIADVISVSDELQIMIPWQPAATNCSTEAVTFSDTCAWSTYCTFTPKALAASSSTRLQSEPKTSVDDQIETPILMSLFSIADAVLAKDAIPAATAVQANALANFFKVNFIINSLCYVRQDKLV